MYFFTERYINIKPHQTPPLFPEEFIPITSACCVVNLFVFVDICLQSNNKYETL